MREITIYDSSEKLRIGSNTADINRFRSYTGVFQSYVDRRTVKIKTVFTKNIDKDNYMLFITIYIATNYLIIASNLCERKNIKFMDFYVVGNILHKIGRKHSSTKIYQKFELARSARLSLIISKNSYLSHRIINSFPQI